MSQPSTPPPALANPNRPGSGWTAVGNSNPQPGPPPQQAAAEQARQQAAEQAQQQTPEVYYADQLAGEQASSEPPPGAELLRDALHLSRRERANLMARLEPIMPQIQKIQELAGQQGDDENATVNLSETLGTAKDAFELMAEIEDALTDLAADEQAFRAWALSATDEALMQLFQHVMSAAGMGVGEGSPSPS